MKYLLAFFFGIAMVGSAFGQIVEVNPSVNWKYIRSQKLDLQGNSVYQYEFPAERGYDYKFNLFYEERGLSMYISIFDIQMKPIVNVVDSVAYKTTELSFTVSQSGTYIVTIGYKNKKSTAGKTTPIEMILIRRPFVE